MSTFEVSVAVAGLDASRFQLVNALVDTGASNSVFPRSLLQELGVEPSESWSFRLADETQREVEVGTARIRLDDRERYSVVVFGDEAMPPILGAITLVEFGLGVDPAGRRLMRVPGLLKTPFYAAT